MSAENTSNSNERYESRGVSASKQDVHTAIKNLSTGLYPGSFCKVFPDVYSMDDQHVLLMSSDGSGTKSILAYLDWKETGKTDAWASIAQDVVVMNLDDLLCMGATGPFLYTSLINRNKKLIPGEVLSAYIQGTQQFFDTMNDHGIQILYTGGETADLGDSVRTITLDATMSVRMKKENLILTQNILPGQVIVGLASNGTCTYETEVNSGIGSNGLTSARHEMLNKTYKERYPETWEPSLGNEWVYCGKYTLEEHHPLLEMTVSKALLSPTRSFAPVLAACFKEFPGKIKGIIHNTGGAFTKVLHYVNNVQIIKNEILSIPGIFKLIQEESKTSWEEMFKVYNCGTRMELYCDHADAQNLISVAESFNVHAQIIGYTEAHSGKKVSVHHQGNIYEYA